VNDKSKSNLCPPDSVRVWRGFRLPALTVDQFCVKLGSVFVPATVKMQIDVGLQAYMPAIPAGLPDKPDTVPDETAILFWESPQTYWNGFTTLAVRTYTLTHGGCYVTDNNQSRADFPVLFAGSLTADQPVYLFTSRADWMKGSVNHVVGARPAAQDPVQFRAAAAAALGSIQRDTALEGAIACAGDDYLVYWELGPAAPGMQHPPSGIPAMQALLGWSRVFAPPPTFVPVGLWDEWAGMDVVSGSSFNMQFTRRPKR
jgi:hypothetical protein